MSEFHKPNEGVAVSDNDFVVRIGGRRVEYIENGKTVTLPAEYSTDPFRLTLYKTTRGPRALPDADRIYDNAERA
ncbi:MAG TPA: hypothetical protein VME40_00845, partial [Caulobacteraceae bacterium]|nr:hypothetical protein [Caulobacteraceae bacterium]